MKTIQNMKAKNLTIKDTGKEFSITKMEEFIMASDKKIKWQDMGYLARHTVLYLLLIRSCKEEIIEVFLDFA